MSLRFLLLLLLSLVLGCGTSGSLGDDDDAANDDDSAVGSDDDDATGDDDDATGDDDDATGDDDDATGDDDDSVGDDDDSVGDDDDSTGLPPTDPEGMVDAIYCLDWNSVSIVQPTPNLLSILNILGVSVADYPMLISPTAVDIANEEIFMLVTGALQGTCNQDLTISTVDLTATQPGVYTPPLFTVGPGDFATTIDGFQLQINGMTLSGQFSVDAAQIYDVSMNGEFVLPPDYESTACSLLNCLPCTDDPNASCLSFEAENAVFNDTGAGPLVVVP